MTRLRNLRLARNLTLKRVAFEIGLSHSQLSRIETGKAPVPPRLVPAFATLFKVDPADVIGAGAAVPVVGLIVSGGVVRRLYPGDDAQGPPAVTFGTSKAVPLLALRVARAAAWAFEPGTLLLHPRAQWVSPRTLQTTVLGQTETGHECVAYCNRGAVVSLSPWHSAVVCGADAVFDRVSPIVAVIAPTFAGDQDNGAPPITAAAD